jgi:hypothetical protein
VERTLFAITCLTCQARLNVRNEAAIGQILTCPKCGSMVEVVPPPGWRSKAGSGPGSDRAKRAAPATSPTEEARPPRKTSPDPIQRRVPAGPPPAEAKAASRRAETPVPPVAPAASNSPPLADPAPPVQPPETVSQTVGSPTSEVAGEPPESEKAEAPAGAGAPIAVAPVELLWRKWLLLATTPVAGLVIAVAVWVYLSSRRTPQLPPAPVAEVP